MLDDVTIVSVGYYVTRARITYSEEFGLVKVGVIVEYVGERSIGHKTIVPGKTELWVIILPNGERASLNKKFYDLEILEV